MSMLQDTESAVLVSLADRSYEIRIGQGLLEGTGTALRRLNLGPKVALVTNQTVGRLYGPRVEQSLGDAGFEVLCITVPDGESAKTLTWASSILDKLVRHRFERSSTLVALGGGVIGDLAGFAAAIFVRGMPLVQIPTTLIAQVDSSVGGKTGVNHRLGKNMIGAFHQPRLVLVDLDTLQTLPKREWDAGLAEVIKYGVIADASLFTFLEDGMEAVVNRDPSAIGRVVRKSCEIKAAVVMEDERETDRRRILNYGHTIGHAIESLGKYRSYIHGEAVGIGMVQEASLAQFLGYCDEEVVVRQRRVVRHAGLPDQLPDVAGSALWKTMQHDKKTAGGHVHCVVPTAIGAVRVIRLEEKDVREWFKVTHRKRW